MTARTATEVSQIRQELMTANIELMQAAMMIEKHRSLIVQFLAESASMASVGPILDPTLWKNPERQRCEAIMKPLFESALRFVDVATATREATLAWAVERQEKADGR